MNTGQDPVGSAHGASCHGLLSRGSSDRYGGASPGPDAFRRAEQCTGPWQFAQLATTGKACATIETCLSVHASKLYHMGFRQPVRRSTLVPMPNERRDWRIHAALAQRLITQARTHVRRRRTGLDLTNTVYALDSTTERSVPVGLSVGALPHHQGSAVKMHTLLDLRGNIASFIHKPDAPSSARPFKPSDMLLPEAGAVYVVDRGYARLCPPLCVAPSRGLLRHACQVEHRCSSPSIRRRRIARPVTWRFATRPSPWTASVQRGVRITPNFCWRRVRWSRTPSPARR